MENICPICKGEETFWIDNFLNCLICGFDEEIYNHDLQSALDDVIFDRIHTIISADYEIEE